MTVATLTRRLSGAGAWSWGAFLIGCVAVHLVLWQISEPTERFSDFFKAYYPVAKLLMKEGPDETWPDEEASTLGFVNIPVLGYVFLPLGSLGEDAAAWTFLALGAAATFGAWRLLVRFVRADAGLAAMLLLVFLANGPLVNSLREGNTTHFVLLLLVAALSWWRSGREFPAGLALGVSAVVKPPLLLFGAYFVLRGRWRVVAGGAAVVGATVALSLAVFGIEINYGWYDCCVRPFMDGVVPAFNVQSVDGFLMRLATGQSKLLDWNAYPRGMPLEIARTVVLAALYVGVLWAIRRGARARAPADRGTFIARDTLEYAIVLLLATVTTPVSWSHYYLWLLLPCCLYLGGALPAFGDAWTPRLVAVGFVLAALPVVILPLQPDWLGEALARTVVSAPLFGGLAVLIGLLRGAIRPHPAAAPVPI